MKIILIGFMGSGKTSVGKYLSGILNLEFFDMDFEIEKKESKSISNIFKGFGEDYFRKIESEMLKNLIRKEKCIISSGGGIVLNNLDILKMESNVIFLDADVNTIKLNLEKDICKRPLIKKENLNEKNIKEILSNRYQKYIDCSDYIIDVNNKSIETISREIIKNVL